MFAGFNRIVEERIRKALKQGDFDDLPGSGLPLRFEEDRHIPEDLRLAYKILKNADCVPPEIELKKQIHHARQLLDNMPDGRAKYRVVNKLNFMIMKFNAMRNGAVSFEMPQHYAGKVMAKFEKPQT